MTTPDRDPHPSAAERGDLTSASGTPVAVQVANDRRDRRILVVLLVGPVVWFTHFMLVYLVAEMGCTGEGQGFERFGPPVPVVTTLGATVAAVAMCVATSVWGWRWWRSSRRRLAAGDPAAGGLSQQVDEAHREGTMAFVGCMLSVFSAIAVLFTAAPAVVLWSC